MKSEIAINEGEPFIYNIHPILRQQTHLSYLKNYPQNLNISLGFKLFLGFKKAIIFINRNRELDLIKSTVLAVMNTKFFFDIMEFYGKYSDTGLHFFRPVLSSISQTRSKNKRNFLYS